MDLEHVPLHLEGTLLLLIDTYSFLPTLVELACAFRYFGVTGLYISYVAGAVCKVGSLWFNVTNHPPEQLVDGRGCGAVDDVHKEALQTPNVFFAMVQEVMWPYTYLIGEAAHDHHHVRRVCLRRAAVPVCIPNHRGSTVGTCYTGAQTGMQRRGCNTRSGSRGTNLCRCGLPCKHRPPRCAVGAGYDPRSVSPRAVELGGPDQEDHIHHLQQDGSSVDEEVGP